MRSIGEQGKLVMALAVGTLASCQRMAIDRANKALSSLAVGNLVGIDLYGLAL